MDPLADMFLECLNDKYQENDERLISKINHLKRKLEENEFSDNDEDLVQELDRLEKKRKLEYSYDFCGKQFSQKGNKNKHMKTHFVVFDCTNCGACLSRDYTRKQHERKCTIVATAKKNETSVVNIVRYHLTLTIYFSITLWRIIL